MNEDDITGVWSGTYSLPYGLPSVSFTATLLQSGSFVSGTTHESCSVSECPIRTHNAMLSGSRSGVAISFVKAYDPPGFGYATVSYNGVLSGHGTEISGAWNIGPGLVGQFLMIRAGRKAKAKARRKMADV